MFTQKKRIVQKSAIIFICVMLFFTFSSKTILYFMTPKVIAEGLKSGYIISSYSFSSVEILFENNLKVAIPFKPEQPFLISGVLVQAGSRVKKGEDLIFLNKYSFEQILAEQKKKVDGKKTELLEFDKSMSDRIRELEEIVSDCTLKIELGIEARKDLEYKKQNAVTDLEYITDTGIFNATTRKTILTELKKEEVLLNDLKSLSGSSIAIKAPADGIVTDITVKEQDKYEGIDTLLSIAPEDTKIKLMVKIEADQVKKFEEGASCSISFDDKTIKGKIGGLKNTDGTYYLVLEPESTAEIDLLFLNDADIKVETESEYYNIIIPNAAFAAQDNEVFILRTRKGFWGKEYYVQRQRVQIGEENEYYTSVESGLSNGDIVVTGWDRDLTDGASVMLPLE